MKNKLKVIVEEIAETEIDEFSDISDLSELDFWDSISRVQLIISIESEIGRDLNDIEIESISKVDFLTKLLNR